MSEALRLLVIGAHPDDAEFKAGGLAALYRSLGCEVRFVSLTNGESGHQGMNGVALVARRKMEAERAASLIGSASEVWDHPDGRLLPSLELREQVIRLIRRVRPDLVLTHRPNDYHPDHRATSQLVQDAAYMLTVPAICSDVPHLARDPVIGYLTDDFTRPCRFEPSVVLDISPVWDLKVALLDAHASQFYEWLPSNMAFFASVPANALERRVWLSERIETLSSRLADRFRERLIHAYGPEHGRAIRRVEAFEGCEYGAPLDESAIARLFPFHPARDT